MGKAIILIQHWQSPAGELILGSYGDALCMCDWANQRHRATTDRRICRILDAQFRQEPSNVISLAITQLRQYFDGKRTDLDIPVVFAGSDFQCKVWEEISRIPYSHTISYAEVAHRIGHPTATRAVANAVGANPLSIFVPCHRVTGSNGYLGGYAAGIDAKLHLLRLEADNSLSSNLFTLQP